MKTQLGDLEAKPLKSRYNQATSLFTFSHHPGKTVVRFEDDPVLTFVQEHLVFRGFRIIDIKLRPHGPVELIALQPSTFFGPDVLRCKVRPEIVGPLAARVTLTPAEVEADLLSLAREQREFLIEYLPDRQRFRHTITVRLNLLADIRGGEGLILSGMPQQDGDDFVAVEFDDPMLAGGVGPQVPMTQDWTGLAEPRLAEDQFTTAWRKRYLGVVLPTIKRGLRTLTFNRVVNGVQYFYNRSLPALMPRQPFLYAKSDGTFLVFRPLFDYPASHHICEWGYDMHLCALLPRPAPGLLFRKGQTIQLAYQVEEITRTEAPAGYLDAPPAEIEPKERARADQPIYEEPRCGFTRSALDCPDQYDWIPGPRCVWNRTGGREAGTGALEIHSETEAGETAWTFPYFGPSYACNPIPPASRFKVSAWVKAEEPDRLTLSLTLNALAGPAGFSARTPITSTGAARDLQSAENGWRRIEFMSQPSGAYTLDGEIRFAYGGRGDAVLSGLSLERL